MSPTLKKRNYYISYIKGFAILSVMIIHLIDWSNLVLSPSGKIAKELFYTAVLFFISTVGSVIYIAYNHYDNLVKPTKRLITRGLQLIGVYFLYNIIKLFIFDFSKEPFFWQFTEKQTLNVFSILTLQSFTVPITIIFTIAVFLIISPLFLYIVKRTKYPKIIIGVLIVAMIGVNYILPVSSHSFTNFLYSQGYVIFPLALWFLPYLIGLYLAVAGFEKQKGRWLIFFLILTGLFGYMQWSHQQSLFISPYMYPLQLYYIAFSFFFMYVLMYLFSFLEKIKHVSVSYFLAIMRVLGDSTLSLYMYHWIVIDISLWLFFPSAKIIWMTVPVFLLSFLWVKRKMIQGYVE